MFKLTRLATLLVIAAAFTGFTPVIAHAQKPALVKSVDEPGRSPYQSTITFNQNLTTCINNYSCGVPFPPVPQGFRLVITHVNAFFNLNGGNLAHLYLGAGSSSLRLRAVSIGSESDSSITYIADSPVTLYAEPGIAPFVELHGNTFKVNGFFNAEVTLVGYLVAIP
jgi:hypothetical protein